MKTLKGKYFRFYVHVAVFFAAATTAFTACKHLIQFTLNLFRPYWKLFI